MPGVSLALTEPVFGILGHPLGQSLSPALHGWALARGGLPGQYRIWDTPPENLAAFMRAFRTSPYAGASVTIPHKEAVIPFLDTLTPTAAAIGAVNTLFWEQGVLTGHNTDMEGFLAPLSGRPAPGTVLVLGAGGAARAVLAALAACGAARVILAARSREKAQNMAAAFAPSLPQLAAIPWEERLAISGEGPGELWVINTTPLGMRGKAEGESPLPQAWFAAHGPGLAYDLVYNPLQTAFLAFARAAGWQCRDGLEMFAGQGAAQFRLWTGQEMPLDEARILLASHLAPSPGA